MRISPFLQIPADPWGCWEQTGSSTDSYACRNMKEGELDSEDGTTRWRRGIYAPDKCGLAIRKGRYWRNCREHRRGDHRHRNIKCMRSNCRRMKAATGGHRILRLLLGTAAMRGLGALCEVGQTLHGRSGRKCNKHQRERNSEFGLT